MNIDVAQRLIDNLEMKPIEHDQGIWLRNGGHVFIASKTNKWSCATRACAAGFLYLEEAEEGSVFDTELETVFTGTEEWEKYRSYQDGYHLLGTDIVSWGADILGVDYGTAHDLFYDFGETEHIVDVLKAMIENDTPEGDTYL